MGDALALGEDLRVHQKLRSSYPPPRAWSWYVETLNLSSGEGVPRRIALAGPWMTQQMELKVLACWHLLVARSLNLGSSHESRFSFLILYLPEPTSLHLLCDPSKSLLSQTSILQGSAGKGSRRAATQLFAAVSPC